jgi:hypothetical protein
MTAEVHYLKREQASLLDEIELMGETMLTVYVYLISLGGILAVIALCALAETWLVERDIRKNAKIRKRPF